MALEGNEGAWSVQGMDGRHGSHTLNELVGLYRCNDNKLDKNESAPLHIS